MSPMNLESKLFLNANKSFWGIYDEHNVVCGSHNGDLVDESRQSTILDDDDYFYQFDIIPYVDFASVEYDDESSMSSFITH